MPAPKFSLKLVREAPSPAAQLASQQAMHQKLARQLIREIPELFPDGVPYTPGRIELPETLERSLIVAALEFANASDDFDRGRAIDIFFAWLPSPKIHPFTSRRILRQSMRKLAELRTLSDGLQKDLHVILAKRKDYADPALDRICTDALSNSTAFALVPFHHIDGRRRLKTEYRPMGDELATVLNFCRLLLLSDDGRTYGAELRRCTWDRCRKFFLASRKGQGSGRAPTMFCNDKCKNSHHNAEKSKGNTGRRKVRKRQSDHRKRKGK